MWLNRVTYCCIKWSCIKVQSSLSLILVDTSPAGVTLGKTVAGDGDQVYDHSQLVAVFKTNVKNLRVIAIVWRQVSSCQATRAIKIIWLINNLIGNHRFFKIYLFIFTAVEWPSHSTQYIDVLDSKLFFW